jgi:protease II
VVAKETAADRVTLTANHQPACLSCREPAKYVATLRYLRQQQQQQQQQQEDTGTKADNSSSSTNTTNSSSSMEQKPLLLMTDLEAGHFAASGASSRLEERAMKVAFLLANLGC